MNQCFNSAMLQFLHGNTLNKETLFKYQQILVIKEVDEWAQSHRWLEVGCEISMESNLIEERVGT